jgi:hypothetical protein
MERTFAFDWNQAEMTRAIRAAQWGSPVMVRRQLTVLVGTVAAMAFAFWLLSRTAENQAELWQRYLPWIGVFVVYFGLATWFKPIVMARRFARHRPAAGTRLTRTIGDTGLRAEADSGALELKWVAMTQVVETAEFFLFYGTRGEALYLPKRAVPDGPDRDELRDLVRRHLGERARMGAR